MSDSDEWDSGAESDNDMIPQAEQDDWEDEVSEDEDDIKERKAKEARDKEERKRYKEMEKEIREKLLAEGALQSHPTGGKYATKNTGMFKKYNEIKSDFSIANDLFQSDGQKFQIELLEPQTKGDFKDYMELLATLLHQNSNNKHFKAAFLDLISRVTDKVDYPVKDLKALVSHCEDLITIKNSSKKDNSNTEKKKVYSKKVISEIEEATQGDMFASISENAPAEGEPEAEGEESEGETDFDSDDDFM